MYLPLAVLVAVAFYFGSNVMESILNAIPQFVQDGLTIAAGILPALGFAILLRMIVNKRIIAFLIIGFVLTAYLGMPVLGVAILAVGILLLMAFGEEKRPLMDTGEGKMEVEEDEDF